MVITLGEFPVSSAVSPSITALHSQQIIVNSRECACSMMLMLLQATTNP